MIVHKWLPRVKFVLVKSILGCEVSRIRLEAFESTFGGLVGFILVLKFNIFLCSYYNVHFFYLWSLVLWLVLFLYFKNTIHLLLFSLLYIPISVNITFSENSKSHHMRPKVSKKWSK